MSPAPAAFFTSQPSNPPILGLCPSYWHVLSISLTIYPFIPMPYTLVQALASHAGANAPLLTSLAIPPPCSLSYICPEEPAEDLTFTPAFPGLRSLLWRVLLRTQPCILRPAPKTSSDLAPPPLQPHLLPPLSRHPRFQQTYL